MLQYLHSVLSVDGLGDCMIAAQKIYHTVARVKTPESYSFGFNGDATINLLPAIEDYNFRELDAGVILATAAPESKAYLQALDNDEREVGRVFFEYQQNKILLKK